jgi:hypothetical protein
MHKKFFKFPLTKLNLFAATCLAACIGTVSAQVKANEKADLPTLLTTEWPGIKSSIWEIRRIANNRLLFRISFDNISSSSAHMAGEVRMTSDGPQVIPYDISSNAQLTDEKTQISYKADKGNPCPSGFGFRPGDGTIVNITFPAPPPPPPAEKPDAKPEKQTVSIRLPKVKEPFRNIVIPQNEGEVIKFHPN